MQWGRDAEGLEGASSGVWPEVQVSSWVPLFFLPLALGLSWVWANRQQGLMGLVVFPVRGSGQGCPEGQWPQGRLGGVANLGRSEQQPQTWCPETGFGKQLVRVGPCLWFHPARAPASQNGLVYLCIPLCPLPQWCGPTATGLLAWPAASLSTHQSPLWLGLTFTQFLSSVPIPLWPRAPFLSASSKSLFPSRGQHGLIT